MLVPSSMSSEQQTNESISLRGSSPASAYARLAASNISSLYEMPAVVGANPDQPIPVTPTRSPMTPHVYRRGTASRIAGRPERVHSPRIVVLVSDLVWAPTPEYRERANVTRFMRTHGIETSDELVQRSVADIAWFWDAVVDDLEIEFLEPYRRVLDSSRRIEWMARSEGGR